MTAYRKRIKKIKSVVQDALLLKQRVLNDSIFFDSLSVAIEVLVHCLQKKRKILIIGNGGSAADAQHFASELTGTFNKEKRRGLCAIALTTDTSFLTAWSNDFCFETIFSRQIESIGSPGDILFCISTSGNSENIILAAKTAKKMKLRVIALSGHDGGALNNIADTSIIVPSTITARIQEIHILTIHSMCEEIISALFPSSEDCNDAASI